MIKFADAIKLIASRAGQEITQTDKNGFTVEDVLKRMFNLRYQDFSVRHKWHWLKKTSTLQTISNYKTGTVAVTGGSRSVTGTGVSFTSDMKGRYLKLDKDIDMYEILDVPDSLTLTLKEKYIGSSSSDESYLIWKRYYSLPCDCRFNSKITLWQYPYRSTALPTGDINLALSKGYLEGFPKYWGWAKLDRKETTYTTGTISGTKNTKTVTGVGTSFIDGLSEGCEIVKESYTYNVESINSDEEITLIQNLMDDLTGSTYTGKIKNRPQIVFSSVPTPQFNFHVDYPKKVYNLVNDEDTLEIWEGYEHIVIDAVLFEYLDKLTSDRAFNWFKVYESEVEKAWMQICNDNPEEYATVERGVEVSGYRSGLYS